MSYEHFTGFTLNSNSLWIFKMTLSSEKDFCGLLSNSRMIIFLAARNSPKETITVEWWTGKEIIRACRTGKKPSNKSVLTAIAPSRAVKPVWPYLPEDDSGGTDIRELGWQLSSWFLCPWGNLRSINCKKSPREKLKGELQAAIAYRFKGVCISK